MSSEVERHISECPVCWDVYKSPKVLICQHSFCESCCKRLEKRARGISFVICPVCKRHCRVNEIKADFRLGQFIEALTEKKVLKAIELEQSRKRIAKEKVDRENACALCENVAFEIYCEQCKQWLCNSCKIMHSRCKATENHSFILMAEEAVVLQAQFHELFQKFRSKDYRALTATDNEIRRSALLLQEEKYNFLSDLEAVKKDCCATVNQFFDDIGKKADLKTNQLNRLQEKSNEYLVMEHDVMFLEGVAALGGTVNAQFITQHIKALKLMQTLEKSCEEFVKSSAQLRDNVKGDFYRVKVNKEKFLELLKQSVSLEKIEVANLDTNDPVTAEPREPPCTVSRNPDADTERVETLDREASTNQTGSNEQDPAMGSRLDPGPSTSSQSCENQQIDNEATRQSVPAAATQGASTRSRSRNRSRSPLLRLSPERSSSPHDLPRSRSSSRQSSSARRSRGRPSGRGRPRGCASMTQPQLRNSNPPEVNGGRGNRASRRCIRRGPVYDWRTVTVVRGGTQRPVLARIGSIEQRSESPVLYSFESYYVPIPSRGNQNPCEHPPSPSSSENPR